MEDFTGITFNYLTGVRATDKRKCGNTVWVWKCQCGNETEVRSALVKNGHTKSCGCYKETQTDILKTCRFCGETSYRRTQNGARSSVCEKCFNKQGAKSRDPILVMLSAARARAKKAGVAYSLTKEEVEVPEYCPILGIKLEQGTVKERDNSPSLDRIKSELGYIPGNVAVISFKANRIKNHGTAEQHRRIADWMDAQTQSTEEFSVIDPELIELGRVLGDRLIASTKQAIEEAVTGTTLLPVDSYIDKNPWIVPVSIPQTKEAENAETV